MQSLRSYPCRHCHGGSIIGILIVVVIVMLLILFGPLSPDKKTSVPQAITHIDHSAEIACQVDRDSIKTNLLSFQMSNPGTPITIDILAKKTSVPQCPRGGSYLIGKDGVVYCTKHFPPPPEELQQVVQQQGQPGAAPDAQGQQPGVPGQQPGVPGQQPGVTEPQPGVPAPDGAQPQNPEAAVPAQ